MFKDDLKLCDLRDEVMVRALRSYEVFLDTAHYFPEKYHQKLSKTIYKTYKRLLKRCKCEACKPVAKESPAPAPPSASVPAPNESPAVTSVAINPSDITVLPEAPAPEASSLAPTDNSL
ncbi:MAG: hypothetical protein FWD49_07915 [Firmicutes bacterium]|nr:hypothetical protein [Bacillota bacterium]